MARRGLSGGRPPDAANRLRPDHAPTPFSADEIRAGCGPGRTIRVRVEPAEGEPFLRVSRFLAGDAAGALHEQSRYAMDGTPLDTPSARRVAWAELQAHASFPASATAIAAETRDLPIGRLACWRYAVREGGATRTFWFARDLPGMPVEMEERDEAGALRLRMVAVENLPGSAGG